MPWVVSRLPGSCWPFCCPLSCGLSVAGGLVPSRSRLARDGTLHRFRIRLYPCACANFLPAHRWVLCLPPWPAAASHRRDASCPRPLPWHQAAERHLRQDALPSFPSVPLCSPSLACFPSYSLICSPWRTLPASCLLLEPGLVHHSLRQCGCRDPPALCSIEA